MPRSREGSLPSPFGSTLWERWPSFGRVLSRVGGNTYEFKPFRGESWLMTRNVSFACTRTLPG